ncbi:f8a55e37-ee01-4c25-a0df-dd7d585d4d86 [Thermothielavioides terrestris]|uniref:F8a55e37-ee01-4c25-a0df-dd7d585d4d86 n=1 Tax=Thermothielavioides terrestris TaxID=2587410 RepID=A0A3S4BMN2_9PEZI|nr:f8a55e37-ee01-4c25-a0df-dd7d585d4d86 [Thermothielavioides terrestris]
MTVVNYVDSSHWLSILEDIREVRIVHPHKFQAEYTKFWESPSKAPVLWIALLFALLSTATNLLRLARAGKPDDSTLLHARPLQQRTVECLVLGGYATANAYALEALILHTQSRFLSDMDDGSHVHLWFAMGTIIRQAIRMGYHRDPSKMPGISPFDGEMRRRVWLNIFQLDALLSFQMGFPSMIPTECCDAQPPRNLEYSDFSVDMDVLPPSRPLTHDTPVLYIIAKAGIMAVFKKIVAHTESLASPTYDRTIALDFEARAAYARLPAILQRRDVGRSFMDPASRILERCTLELLHLKSLVVLHRRYVSYANTATTTTTTTRPPAAAATTASRRACAEAALDILARQADLHRAARPGGRLHEDRWMLTSLTVHDFLLAAMVLCLDLSVRLSEGEGGAAAAAGGDDDNGDGDGDGDVLARREFAALQTSLQVWTETSALSPEARVAALALELMIRKVSEKNGGIQARDAAAAAAAAAPAAGIDMPPPSSAELPYADLVSEVIDGAETPDWNLLDQYFQHPNMEPAGPTMSPG